MPETSSPEPRPISLRRLDWLETHVRAWQDDGILSGDQAGSILDRYETADAVRQRNARRLFMSLCALAGVMCAAGVLLLIGYNWNALAREIKVGLVFAAVAGCFAGSHIAYRSARPRAGELLAFGGTLMYGCGIWLLAQVFHIQSHYPDGVMWWAIGALAVAGLLSSKLITLEAVILLGLWAVVEATEFHSPRYLFLPLTAVAGLLAYRRKSPALLGLALFAGALWFLLISIIPWDAEEGAATIVLLLGCAYYGVGLLHATRSSFGRAWQIVGLGIVLAGLMPMTFVDFHAYHAPLDLVTWRDALGNPLLVCAAALLVVTVTTFVRRSSTALREDWPVLAVAGLGAIRLFPLGDDEQFMAVLFSAATVVLAIWLMARGVRLDRALSFFTGIVYLLVFVLVRWFDLIGDMISSSILFFVAGGILFATAWFWNRRGREATTAPSSPSPSPPPSPSATEAPHV